MYESMRPVDVHIGDFRKHRIFLAFPSVMAVPIAPEYSAERINNELKILIGKQLTTLVVHPHWVLVAPRLQYLKGQCNWQIVVFFPIPPEVLNAIEVAGAILQTRCNLRDEYQDTRAIIV